MLKIRLLGTGEARYRNRPLASFPNHQYHRLFCYLLLNRSHPHHRERLAAVFWGEHSTSASRQYLRNALWRLRNALQADGVPVEQYLLINEENVSVLTSDELWLDIDHFETIISRYQDIAGQQLTPPEAAQLEKAVDLYGGDLLEGVYEDWCLYDRERLHILHLNALGKLVAFHEHNGTYECGLTYGQRILALDPTREKVHRQLMRLYWQLNEPGEALAQYKCCVQALRQELGTSPITRTKRLYQQIIHHQFNPASWLLQLDDRSPDFSETDESAKALVKHALQELHRLHAKAEETCTELERVEHLISQVLATVNRT
ncbi:MAG: hypothetical protein H6632_19580 [Anaerolineales bacterium]|nr:hypothetical protein [Anaerolineales bacterium]